MSTTAEQDVPPGVLSHDGEEDYDEFDDVLDQFGKPTTISTTTVTTTTTNATTTGRAALSVTASASSAPLASTGGSLPTALAPISAELAWDAKGLGGRLSGLGLEPGGGDAARDGDPAHAAADALAADFALELARGMEALVRELGAERGVLGGAGGGPPGSSISASPAGGEEAEKGIGDKGGGDGEERERTLLRAAWEAMLVEELGGEGGEVEEGAGDEKGKRAAAIAATTGGTGDKRGGTLEEEDAFQRTIRQAMDKLRESEAGLAASAAPDADADAGSVEGLARLLAELGSADGGTDGDDTEIQGLLEGMMRQLTSKEILYEPLKEWSDKFGPYLASPPPDVSPADMARYRAQQSLVSRIIAVFEDPGYHDAPPSRQGGDSAAQPQQAQTQAPGKDAEAVLQLMSELQALGSPPPEIMGSLPPGLNVGPDMENCSLM